MSAEDYEQLWILLVMLPSAAAVFSRLGAGTAGMANARNIYRGQHGVAAALGTAGQHRAGRTTLASPGTPNAAPRPARRPCLKDGAAQTAREAARVGTVNQLMPLVPSQGTTG